MEKIRVEMAKARTEIAGQMTKNKADIASLKSRAVKKEQETSKLKSQQTNTKETTTKITDFLTYIVVSISLVF